MEINRNTYPKIALALFCMLTGLYSCDKNDTVTALNRPVVEAYLVPGAITKVKIYYQKYLDDTITYGSPVKNLKVNISDGTNKVLLKEETEGTYLWEAIDFIKTGKTYSLSFDYDGNTVSAQTTVPEKPVGFKESSKTQYVQTFSFNTTPKAFTPVVFSWNNSDQGNYLIVFKNISPYPSSIANITNITYEDFETDLGQASVYQTQRPTFSFTGDYKVLLFHINKEYSDALTSSGTTSLNLTNPYTNVVHGLGIFTAMQADTLDLKVVLE